MRTPKYLSPTSMALWKQDPKAWYVKYMSDNPTTKEPQTVPMSVGSSFDAWVKSFLHASLFGKNADPAFAFEAIFEAQVEPHNRDFARAAGEHCFHWYRRLGCLDQLMVDLGKSVGPPRFEMDVRGEVSHGKVGSIHGVPYRVKPDLFFINEHGAHVILDWKVNGYMSKAGVSPMKGFIRARRHGKMPWTHADAVLKETMGLIVNVAAGLEAYDAEWATQVSVGAWMSGEDVGSPFIAMIHQLACRPGDTPATRNVTIAEHVCHVSPDHQLLVHAEANLLWQAITEVISCVECAARVSSGALPTDAPTAHVHVFRNLSIHDSVELCKVLDQRRDTLDLGVGAYTPEL